MEYDEEGNLLLSGKLGSAVSTNEFGEFAEAVVSGKSEGLTYADMQAFQEFTSEFFRVGDFPSPAGGWYLILKRKEDQATFGIVYYPSQGLAPAIRDEEDNIVWKYVPMNETTIKAYTPAE